MKPYLITLLTLALLGPCAGQTAGVFKWVDENGKVHYGDQPGSTSARPVPIAPAPPVDESLQKRREQQAKQFQALDEDRKKGEDEAVKVKQKEDERKVQCIAAQAKLKDYERARYLYKPEEGGQETILSEAEREAATAETKKEIEELCS